MNIIGSSRNERWCWPTWTTRPISKLFLRKDTAILHYSWCRSAAGQLSLISLGVIESFHIFLSNSFGNMIILYLRIWNVEINHSKQSKIKRTAVLSQTKYLSCQLWMHRECTGLGQLHLFTQEGLSTFVVKCLLKLQVAKPFWTLLQ